MRKSLQQQEVKLQDGKCSYYIRRNSTKYPFTYLLLPFTYFFLSSRSSSSHCLLPLAAFCLLLSSLTYFFLTLPSSISLHPWYCTIKFSLTFYIFIPFFFLCHFFFKIKRGYFVSGYCECSAK